MKIFAFQVEHNKLEIVGLSFSRAPRGRVPLPPQKQNKKCNSLEQLRLGCCPSHLLQLESMEHVAIEHQLKRGDTYRQSQGILPEFMRLYVHTYK